MSPLPSNTNQPRLGKAVAFLSNPGAITAVFAVVFVWSYWTTLTTMADRWSRDPQYSHGFLVPVFALVVLWFRRDWLAKAAWEPSLLGLPILAVGVVLRLVAIRRDIEPLDAFSLLPTLFGLVLLVGGRGVLRWSWPAIAFLAFMIPLPFFVEVALAHPLRRVATDMSTYTLQTLGYPAIAEGNIILIDQVRLGVVEACSGLGMLSTFIALSTALALVTSAPLLDRLVLVASSIPIALISNVVRITATGVALHTFGGTDAQAARIHDIMGLFMMPFALLLLWLELRFMSYLLVLKPPVTAPTLVVPGLTLKG